MASTWTPIIHILSFHCNRTCNGKPIENKNIKATYDKDSGTAVLSFSSLSCSDSGLYECVCKSHMGTAKTGTNMTVKSKIMQLHIVYEDISNIASSPYSYFCPDLYKCCFLIC